MPVVPGKLSDAAQCHGGLEELATAAEGRLAPESDWIAVLSSRVVRVAVAAFARRLALVGLRNGGDEQLPFDRPVRRRARAHAPSTDRSLSLRKPILGEGAVARVAQVWSRGNHRRATCDGAVLAPVLFR